MSQPEHASGRIGLIRAENSSGAIVAIGREWVTVLRATPAAGVVELHTGRELRRRIPAGTVLQIDPGAESMNVRADGAPDKEATS